MADISTISNFEQLKHSTLGNIITPQNHTDKFKNQNDTIKKPGSTEDMVEISDNARLKSKEMIRTSKNLNGLFKSQKTPRKPKLPQDLNNENWEE